MKKTSKLPPNPCPGFRPHDLPQLIPVLNWQVGWLEPQYKDAVCCVCGVILKKIPEGSNTGGLWTRVLGSNKITCTLSCATKEYFGDKDPLKEILYELFLLSRNPSAESVAVFSQKGK